MKILLFAQARLMAGCDEIVLKVDNAMTESEFWERLIVLFPGLAPLQTSARLARNESYVARGDLLFPDDEVAVIPPVSGG